MIDDLTRREFLLNAARTAAGATFLGLGGCSQEDSQEEELTQIIEATKIPNMKEHHIEGMFIVRGKKIDALGGYRYSSHGRGGSSPICETYNTETNESWSILEGVNIPLARTAHFTKGDETFFIGGFKKSTYCHFTDQRLDDPNLQPWNPDTYVGCGEGDFFGVPGHAAILCYNHKTGQQKVLEDHFPVYIFDGKAVVVGNTPFVVGGTSVEWGANNLNLILYQYDGHKWNEFDRNVVNAEPIMVVAGDQTMYCFTRQRFIGEWHHLLHTYNIYSHEKSKLKLPEEFHQGGYKLIQAFVEDNAVHILGIKMGSEYANCVLYASSPENNSWIKENAFRVTSEVGAYRQFCYVNGDIFCIGGKGKNIREYALRLPVLPSKQQTG